MTRDEVFARIKDIGIIPAIRPSGSDQAVHAAEAICRGGIPVIEISMAMPAAPESIEAVLKAHGNDVLVGAGTVADVEGALRARSSGAQFLVTSGFDADVIRAARELDLPVFAGALTPTEVQMTAACGADAVKLFPCYAVGGPRYVKSMHGQYPDTELIASGGVSLENCSEYLRAGACAIGVGGEIGYAESTAAGDHRVFTERARRFRKAVCEARALFNGSRPR
ncbi:MAG: bifunctional 4-hydroxy-2-oxoglutarate aldolase/2-dehydro-3-deoxy-phosphogluconate aldolase [Acidobacteriota bacterium]|nr:bifunctional 4-hydroxy-2-oxoglutarate aldolase/2-dehydro-3-deoxy-phosphogluconate aldolase [Acidobacteriota bacterium]